MKRVPFQSDFQRNEKTNRTTAKGIIAQEGRCDKWEKGEETEPGQFIGSRPGEFRKLDVLNYDRKEKAVVGGFKTDAGRDRTVTISPKIQPIIDSLVKDKIAGPIFCDENGKELSERKYKLIFNSVLEAIGLDNPEVEINGRKYTKYTPHSCRHTFATLMMKTHGEMGDRLSLIGHANEKILHHYEDIDLDGLREITNKL